MTEQELKLLAVFSARNALKRIYRHDMDEMEQTVADVLVREGYAHWDRSRSGMLFNPKPTPQALNVHPNILVMPCKHGYLPSEVWSNGDWYIRANCGICTCSVSTPTPEESVYLWNKMMRNQS